MTESSSGASMLFGTSLCACLEEEGFFSIGVLSPSEFESVVEKNATDKALVKRYLEQPIGSVVVVALRYGSGDYPLPESVNARDQAGTPSLDIASFARANWYGELIFRLKRAVRNAKNHASQQGLAMPAERQWRRLANSRLPEKSIALAAGLGFMGKNGILIAAHTKAVSSAPSGTIHNNIFDQDKVPLFSSAVVLGLLICPKGFEFSWNLSRPPIPIGGCGTCRRCILACPTAALNDIEPKFVRSSCIQYWTTVEGRIPEAIARHWGRRLYGCDTCLEACPYFIEDEKADTQLGRLGPSMPSSFLLERDEKTIQKTLSGTALGLSWMSIKAFKRSAATIAAAGISAAGIPAHKVGV